MSFPDVEIKPGDHQVVHKGSAWVHITCQDHRLAIEGGDGTGHHTDCEACVITAADTIAHIKQAA